MKKYLAILLVMLLILSGCAPAQLPPQVDTIDDNYRVFYHVFVGSFSDSNEDGLGDLRGLINRLDYINDGDVNSGTDLGAQGIWLSPIFSSPSYHKYDCRDYYKIDSRFGTESDLKELAQLCEERNVKLILDLVLNHSSKQHPWFQSFVAAHQSGDTTDPYYDFYTWVTEDQKVSGRTYSSIVNSGGHFYECNFSGDMPELNLDNEEVRQACLEIARYYLDLGVDGFRFDAIKYAYFGDTQKSAEFWEWYANQLRAIDPDVYMVGECWSSDNETLQYTKGLNCFNFQMAQSEGFIAKAAKGGNMATFTKYVAGYQDKLLATNPDAMMVNFIANNDAGSVAASKVAGELYAYPMTSDNGYYMYYNKSVITNPDDLATIVADAEKANLKVRYALENAWYTASFFFATGCHSNWSMDTEGNYTSVDDDFNSDAGLAAMKGMQILTSSTAYDSNADIFTDAAVVVTGIWNAEAAATHFGENLGVAKLPTFTVDGKTYQLGSYSGFKLMGVKPQTDNRKQAVLHALAQYLTNEENQLARFNSFSWGPSNLKAQQNEAVLANKDLSALAAQNAFGTPQGQIHGSWWDIAKLLGADAKAATSEADLKAALESYENTINALLEMTDEQKNAWGVIGGICGTNWDVDFPMTEDPAGTYTSEVLELNAGEEFKVRQGASWDVNYGADGVAGGNNIKVETTGKYKVQLVINGDTATVTLIPA